MSSAREKQVTFAGNPVTLLGYEAKVGEKARNFSVLDQSLSPVSFEDTTGKIRLLNVVPSLDTPEGDAQTRLFCEAASKFSDQVEIITISMDLTHRRASASSGLSSWRRWG